MAHGHAADDAAIREQAYYFWEQDGRPDGREHEYWMRATVAVTEKAQLDTLTQPAPKKAAKPAGKTKSAAKPAAKAAPKLRAAASKAKAAPAKADKAEKPKKK